MGSGASTGQFDSIVEQSKFPPYINSGGPCNLRGRGNVRVMQGLVTSRAKPLDPARVRSNVVVDAIVKSGSVRESTLDSI